MNEYRERVEKMVIRDAPLDIWGGGGLEFCCLQTLFLPLRENLFFGDQRPTIFFLCFVKDIFVVCFRYYVRYHLVFFLVNIFSSGQQTFFLCPHFQQTFFCGDKLFFSTPPPPPPISNGASLIIIMLRGVIPPQLK